jgi:hypothetical protein
MTDDINNHNNTKYSYGNPQTRKHKWRLAEQNLDPGLESHEICARHKLEVLSTPVTKWYPTPSSVFSLTYKHLNTIHIYTKYQSTGH